MNMMLKEQRAMEAHDTYKGMLKKEAREHFQKQRKEYTKRWLIGDIQKVPYRVGTRTSRKGMQRL
jgi:hypothetical protein